MAKRNFMQTPEQRERANYYSKKRRQQVSDLPLMQEQMVEEQFIETPEVVEQEPVFEYATPSMPSSQEVAATFDTGTAGMWADVVDNITGSIMSVTQDVFEFNAKRKQNKIETLGVDVKDRMSGLSSEMERAYLDHVEAVEAGEQAGPFDESAWLSNAFSNLKLEALQGLANIEYSSEDQQKIISEWMSNDTVRTGTTGLFLPNTFEELTTQEKIMVMEYALFDRQLDPSLNGERTMGRKEEARLGFERIFSSLNAPEMLKEFGAVKERVKEIQSASQGFSSKEYNDSQWNKMQIDPVALSKAGLTPETTIFTKDGQEIPMFSVNEETGVISWSQDPMLLMEQYPQKAQQIGASLTQGFLARLGDPSFVQQAPEPVIEAANRFANNPEDLNSAYILFPYLSAGGEDTVRSLINNDQSLGGAGLNADQKSRILLGLTMYEYYKSEEGGVDVNLALQQARKIDDEAHQRTLEDITARRKMGEEGAYQNRQGVVDILNGIFRETEIVTYGSKGLPSEMFITGKGQSIQQSFSSVPVTIDENTFIPNQNIEFMSLMATLSVIEKSSLDDKIKEPLKQRLIENAHIVPITDENGRLVDVSMGNSWDRAMYEATSGDPNLIINAALYPPKDYMTSSDTAIDQFIKPALSNINLDIDNNILMREPEWSEEVLTKAKEVQRGVGRGLDPGAIYQTMVFMSPEVQEEIFNQLEIEDRSFDTLDDIKENYKYLIENYSTARLNYKMADRTAIKTRSQASPDRGGYAFNASTVEIGGKVIDINPYFTSVNGSDVVFEADFSSVAREGTKQTTTPDTIATHIENQKQGTGLRQSGWGFFMGQQASDEIGEMADPIFVDDLPNRNITMDYPKERTQDDKKQERIVKTLLGEAPLRISSVLQLPDSLEDSNFILSESDEDGFIVLTNLDRKIVETDTSSLSVEEQNQLIAENGVISKNALKEAREFVMTRVGFAVEEIRKKYGFNLPKKDVMNIVKNDEIFKLTYSGVYNRNKGEANYNDLLEGVLSATMYYGFATEESSEDITPEQKLEYQRSKEKPYYYAQAQSIVDNVSELSDEHQFILLQDAVKKAYGGIMYEGEENELRNRAIIEENPALLSGINEVTTFMNTGIDTISSTENAETLLNIYMENLPEMTIAEMKRSAEYSYRLSSGQKGSRYGSMETQIALKDWKEENAFIGGAAWNRLDRQTQVDLALFMIRYLKNERLIPGTNQRKQRLMRPTRETRPEFDGDN
tara:strand:+ start:19116 stop:22826 length:3711 start_codon:yes stop_codon:yes gene_type:complete